MTRFAITLPPNGNSQVVIQGGRDARYLASGHLAYVTGGTLAVVPFDVATLKVTGGPVPLVEGIPTANIQSSSGAAQFDVSRTGTLVYLPANGERQTLVWADRQ